MSKREAHHREERSSPSKREKDEAQDDEEEKTRRPRGKHLLTLEEAGPLQMGFWIPNRVWATSKFLVPLRKHVSDKKRRGVLAPLAPTVAALRAWVLRHATHRMWMCMMIEQANAFVKSLEPTVKEQIEKDGDHVWIESFDSVFEMMSEIIGTSPAFNDTPMVGTPLNALLAVALATDAGVTLFHDAALNAELQKVLQAWNEFLKSPASLDKLDILNPEKPGSWISEAAKKAGVWDDTMQLSLV